MKQKEVVPPQIDYKPDTENFNWLLSKQMKFRLERKYFGLSRLIDIFLRRYREEEITDKIIKKQ